MMNIHNNISENQKVFESVRRKEFRLLKNRIALLTESDRVLMELYLAGTSLYALSQIARSNPGNISRRIDKLRKRLIGGQYLTVLSNRDLFSGTELKIARDYLFRKMTLRELSRKYNVTIYRVRHTIEKVNRLTSVK